MSQRYIQIENFKIHIVWIQEPKGPKCIRITLNIQKLSTVQKKSLQRRVVSGHTYSLYIKHFS